jgi:hypothetical protein
VGWWVPRTFGGDYSDGGDTQNGTVAWESKMALSLLSVN